MRAGQSNKLRRYQTLDGVFEEYKDTWNSLPAFVRAVDELGVVISQITVAAQTQTSRVGSVQEKLAALAALGDATYEAAGAVFSYGAENADHELMGRVSFSRTDITEGREGQVVARCREIHAAATAHADGLADYGITAAKLTALKKKIDAFEAMQTKPRQNISKRSAATKLLPQLIRDADGIVRGRLDKLVVQFKDSAPDFYNAYQAARSIVDSPGGRRANGDETATPTPAPAVQPA